MIPTTTGTNPWRSCWKRLIPLPYPCAVEREDTDLISFDQAQQVLAQGLGDHADVVAVGTTMAKVIEKPDDVTSSALINIKDRKAESALTDDLDATDLGAKRRI